SSSPLTHAAPQESRTMCQWERKVCQCGHAGQLKRMEYSCDIYRRHVFGTCPFDDATSRIHDVLKFSLCPACHARDNDKQRKKSRKNVLEGGSGCSGSSGGSTRR
ncbi:hypothetical protein C8A01DRAFT_20900, partial [Parachaetomium inaequale]